MPNGLLGFELFEPRQVEVWGLGISGKLSSPPEVAPHVSFDCDRSPLPSWLGVLCPRDTLGEPMPLGRVAVSRRADEKARRVVQPAQRNVELGAEASTRAFREAALRALRAHFAHLSRV